MSGVVDGNKKDPGNTGSGFTPGGTTSQLLDGAGNAIDALPPGFVGADDITAAVQDLQTTASPQFAAIQLGNSSDTTLSRSAAGVMAIEGVDAVTLSATQTLTNKTLTAPKLANGGFIADANGNEGLILTTTASAVNEVTLTNAATGNSPQLAATGGDTNIGLKLAGKGTGGVCPQGTGGSGQIVFQTTANGPLSSRVLATSDMPTKRRLVAAIDTSQTIASGAYRLIKWSSASVNTLFTVSGTGNTTLTALTDCVVHVSWGLQHGFGPSAAYPVVRRDGSDFALFGAASMHTGFLMTCAVPLSAGQTLEMALLHYDSDFSPDSGFNQLVIVEA